MNNLFKNSDSFTFHHIGSLSKNLVESENFYNQLGFIFNNRVFDPIQEVNLSFGKNSAGVLLELVEPLANSKVDNLLKRNGPGAYHICFEVNSIVIQEEKLKRSGFICVKGVEKAIAFQNRLVAFYFSPVSGLVELLEKN